MIPNLNPQNNNLLFIIGPILNGCQANFNTNF